MQEKIIQTKNCEYCNSEFNITDKDLEFYDKVSPKFGDRKYSIPKPTLCPNCRLINRLSSRNRRKLYKRKCDKTWKPIISMYRENAPFPVYKTELWYDESIFNGLDYWIDFDFNKTFLENFIKLRNTVPHPHSALAWKNINSDFCNWWADWKDSYLCSNFYRIEDCYYWEWLNYTVNCCDCLNVDNSENIYESVEIDNCYNSKYLLNCKDCRDSIFLRDCVWCENCICCTNLVNKQYYIFNKQYTKDEYFKKSREYNLWNYRKLEELKQNFYDFDKKQIHKNLQYLNCENVEWDYVLNSKNSKDCFYSSDIEDCKHWFYIKENTKTVQDISYFGINMELCYYVATSGLSAQRLIFCEECFNNVSNLLYCSYCVNWTQNCFGCVGLINKQYCILNKQYTKEEYEKLVPQIIEHMQSSWEWWEFFPSSISPFGYNETVAQEYFPLDKNEAKNKWFNWSNYESPTPEVEKIIPAEKLPDDIKQIPDDILNWAIKCEITQKPFRIIKQELGFYRKHNLPIPRKHPDQRHLERVQLRNPRKLFDRKCDKCWINMKTTYSPDREEIVYCEKCYNEDVY